MAPGRSIHKGERPSRRLRIFSRPTRPDVPIVPSSRTRLRFAATAASSWNFPQSRHIEIQGTSMKKPLATALTLLLGATAISAHAADGMVKITGSVVGTTCKVGGTKTETGGPAGTLNTINVELDPVSVSALDSVGKSASSKPFKISLTDCTAKNAQVKFETYGSVDTQTGFLKNAGSAKNVQVALLTGDDQLINLANEGGSQVVKLNEGKADIDLRASYVAVGGAAEPGSVDTTAMFSMKYE
ncbi:type 1 fimbrial protein [Pseudomonas aeruginosa]|nr:type 1 fimbrial protein [Pseudomonas aeruginosa]MCO1766923.1 type 1 fimbrial protein [Pseudomonas aeruginosa]